jgi:hypothetical protein
MRDTSFVHLGETIDAGVRPASGSHTQRNAIMGAVTSLARELDAAGQIQNDPIVLFGGSCFGGPYLREAYLIS